VLFSSVFVDTEPRSAKLHQRLDHEPTFACSDALSVRFLQAIYFQLLACSSTQRPRSMSFSFNHFHIPFIVTEGAPHLPILEIRHWSLIARHFHQPLSFHILAHSFAFFCIFLHSRETQLFPFQSLLHSLPKNGGMVEVVSPLRPRFISGSHRELRPANISRSSSSRTRVTDHACFHRSSICLSQQEC